MLVVGIYWRTGNKDKEVLNRLAKLMKNQEKNDQSRSHYQSQELDVFSIQLPLVHSKHSVIVGDRGILVGTVFHKKDFQSIRSASFNPTAEEDVEFTRKYWGTYIRIAQLNGQVSILRDPVGHLSLFYVLKKDYVLFASSIESLIEILGQKPSFNKEYLSAFILYNNGIRTLTPFEDILELPIGCSLTLTPANHHVKAIWDPSDYINQKLDQPLVDTLSESLSKVTESLVSPYKDIFLDFSGGLDSTAVLFCLNSIKKPGQNIHAINMFHSQFQASNELVYARAIAKEINIKLIEFDIADCLPFAPAFLPYKPNMPGPGLTHLAILHKIYEFCGSSQDSLFLSGQGGDHLFLSHPPVESLGDLLLAGEPSLFLSKLKELSCFYRKPYLPILNKILQAVAAYGLYKSHIPEQLVAKKTGWLKADILPKNLLHPWYNKRKHVLPGKQLHCDFLYDALGTIQADTREYYQCMCYPLLSQPIIEKVLSVGMHEFYDNDFTRLPFRKAISKTFNTQQVWRKNKGSTAGPTLLGLKKNRTAIFEYCLEGRMVKEGLVYKDGVYSHLNVLMAGQCENLWPIMNLISLEMYLSYWD